MVEEIEAKPFVAPCRDVSPSDPIVWLRAGWADLRAAGRHSLSYGLIAVLLSWALTLLSLEFGTIALYLGLLSGAIFLGPLLAVGIYEISRQLQHQEPADLRASVRAAVAELPNLLVFGLAMMVVFLIWARAASLTHIFSSNYAAPTFVESLPFLVVGTVVGSLFCSVIFAASAFGLPMLMDRETDTPTAVVTSVNAVLRNKPAMAVWIGIIVLALAFGFATAYVGFVVSIPLIGHATWHAYGAVIDASEWPERDYGP